MEDFTSNTWGITVKDGGEVSNTFIGDQHPQMDAANQYKWNETTWAADGTLVNGVVGPDFNDVLVGTAGVDKISGRGGNDALGGGDGNDQMDGGDGDDLIAGGNDHIFSSANLQLGSGIRQVGLRVGSDDTWTMPAGDTLWKKGSTWGISQDADGLVVFPFSKLTQPDAAPDVIEAGDGNDEVVGGLGDDTLYGGLSNDQMHGDDGKDYLGAGDDANHLSRISPVHGICAKRLGCYRDAHPSRGSHRKHLQQPTASHTNTKTRPPNRRLASRGCCS